MGTIFFTGFPGFLGAELLPRVLARSEHDRAVCLVQPKFADMARQKADALMAATPELKGRIRLLEGDITDPGLGLRDAGDLHADVVEIFHLAAVYDLAVPRDVGLRINVDGTRHVLDFAERCGRLERFQYVSTCYVSGRYAGIFAEEDLDKRQHFNNYYEETKFLAEVDVRARMERGLPATIYRPSIVVGDSRTGETQKYDGPYFVIGWLLRQPKLAVMPVVGDPTAVRLNVVPRDFVIDAMAYLSGLPASAGRCYQLADPDPLTVDEILHEMMAATGRTIVRIPLPLKVAKGALAKVPPARWLMRMPPESVDYFVHPTFYLTTNVDTDLAGSGIACPPFASYLDELVSYMKAHPEHGSAAMI